MRNLNLLLLCDDRDDIGATVHDHILALKRHSRHHYFRLSMLGDIPPALELERFDGVVVHYTLVACNDSYLSRQARSRLKKFKGLKAIFIQDEYRFVDATIAAMREIGVSLLFTCVPAEEVEKVYATQKLPGVVKVSVLTGYVPENLAARAVPSPGERPIDIGYRGRKVPAWLGELGQEKWSIGVRMAADAPRYGLVTDISFREEDRLYGEAWIGFVGRCKSMLGVESGASVFDFTGDIQKRVERYASLHPTATFNELRDRFFAAEEGRIRLNQISPRCFESAALRTLMILYEGEYSGILQPWRHYVPLRKDHANMGEIVAVLRDPARIISITDRAYQEIALDPRYSFARFVETADAAIERAMMPEMLAALAPYDSEDLVRSSRTFGTLRRRAQRWIFTSIYHMIFRTILGHASPEKRDRIHGRLRQIVYVLVSVKRWAVGLERIVFRD